MRLPEVDRVSITLLMDNYTDRLLASSQVAKRVPMVGGGRVLSAPVAEHGFSALVKVHRGQHHWRFLFDTGVSSDGMVNNADIFGVSLDVDAIILSHGHFDHFTGLASALARIGSPTKVIVHPDAFLRRWLIFPDGERAMLPYMDEEELKRKGAVIVKSSAPTGLPAQDPCLLVTGEISRRTGYEIGFPLQHAETERGLVHDPLVRDDQAIVVNVKDKGIVIMSGCGHAGVINTIQQAIELTGVDKVHAVVGGFHLTGPMYEAAIEPTISALKEIGPRYIVPCHCTGWKAVNRVVEEFPEEFIQPSVGTTLDFYTV